MSADDGMEVGWDDWGRDEVCALEEETTRFWVASVGNHGILSAMRCSVYCFELRFLMENSGSEDDNVAFAQYELNVKN